MSVSGFGQNNMETLQQLLFTSLIYRSIQADHLGAWNDPQVHKAPPLPQNLPLSDLKYLTTHVACSKKAKNSDHKKKKKKLLEKYFLLHIYIFLSCSPAFWIQSYSELYRIVTKLGNMPPKVFLLTPAIHTVLILHSAKNRKSETFHW